MQIITEPIVLYMKSFHLTDEEFYNFCMENQQLKLERNADGQIMSWRTQMEKQED